MTTTNMECVPPMTINNADERAELFAALDATRDAHARVELYKAIVLFINKGELPELQEELTKTLSGLELKVSVETTGEDDHDIVILLHSTSFDKQRIRTCVNWLCDVLRLALEDELSSRKVLVEGYPLAISQLVDA